MKKVVLLVLATIMMMYLGCASTMGSFKEPTSDDTMIVIGHIIIEDDYYTNETGSFRKGMEVAIVGKTEKSGDVGLWATTDENGYFALADVPKGEYAIKGVRTIVGRPPSAITITNRLRLSTDPYRVTNTETPIQFTAVYFPFEPKGRVQSLQHVIFKLDKMSSSTGMANYTVKNSLKDYQLVDGTVENAGPVEEYFVEKHPESAWKSLLEESAKTIRFRR